MVGEFALALERFDNTRLGTSRGEQDASQGQSSDSSGWRSPFLRSYTHARGTHVSEIIVNKISYLPMITRKATGLADVSYTLIRWRSDNADHDTDRRRGHT